MDPSLCKSHDDVCLHLVSQFSWVEPPHPRQGDWEQVFGFTRAMAFTSIWRHVLTGEYCLHVDDGGHVGGFSIPEGACARDATFMGLLNSAAAMYFLHWQCRPSCMPC